MGTRSMIACLLEDGKWGAVYCHWDGYLEGVGLTLHTHWPTIQCARILFSNGAMSSLGTHLGHKFDFKDRTADDTQCIFYARDRGDDIDEMRARYDRAADVMRAWYNGEFDAAYCYLHSGHEWMLVDWQKGYTARPLREALEEIGATVPRIVARQRHRPPRIPRAVNYGD